MEKCVRCGRTEEEIRLLDGIYVNDMVKICEKCALVSNIPVIKRPSAEQLKDSEKPYGVRDRLKRMAHLDPKEKKEKSIYEEFKKLEENPDLEKPEESSFKLVDNFHWVLQRERRRKGFSTRQLAESINQSESAIILLEKGLIPSKSEELIRAIEQFLNLKLIKQDIVEILEAKRAEEEKANNFIASSKPELVSNWDSSKNRPISLHPNETRDFRVNDLIRLNQKIDADFKFPKSTKEEVGIEQLESFGKEDTEKIKNKIMNTRKTPSIYDLMKNKQEREKSLVGRDIELVKDEDLE